MASNPSVYQFSQLFAASYKQAMTKENVKSGFKKAGVFPLNRQAIKLKPAPDTPLANKAKEHGMPFHTPVRKLKSRKSESLLSSPELTGVVSCGADKPTMESGADFTREEMTKFVTRFKEGFNITTDVRYNKWLEIAHPQHSQGACDREEVSASPPPPLFYDDGTDSPNGPPSGSDCTPQDPIAPPSSQMRAKKRN